MDDLTDGPPIYIRVLALGAVCGLRTMLGPALIARMASPQIKWALRLLSAGELVVDKLPQTPSRLAPGPLFARALSGASVGYALCRMARKPVWVGALLGGAAAVGGAFGGYHGRKVLGERLHLPDPAVAVLEDAIGVGVGRYFGP